MFRHQCPMHLPLCSCQGMVIFEDFRSLFQQLESRPQRSREGWRLVRRACAPFPKLAEAIADFARPTGFVADLRQGPDLTLAMLMS